MIFKRGLNEEDSAPVFIVDCISESRAWSRPGMQGIESAAPLYLTDNSNNVSMAACRQQKTNNGFHHVFIADSVAESSLVSNKTGEITSQFPLAIKNTRRVNFNQEMLQLLFSDVEQPDENSRKVHPIDIFDYIYAALSSPSYRKKYQEFLKTDFPRVPRPPSWKEFWRLAALGSKLRQLHLMTSTELDELITSFPQPPESEEVGSIVEKVVYTDGKVWINKCQYFDRVPELAWNFYIGGYQPLQKYLKDRKGKSLTDEQILHWQRIVKVLMLTHQVMEEIG